MTLVDNLSRSLAEVRILGSDVVRQLAGRAAAHVLEFRAAMLEKERSSVDTAEIPEVVNESLFLLERMMASDLGISDIRRFQIDAIDLATCANDRH